MGRNWQQQVRQLFLGFLRQPFMNEFGSGGERFPNVSFTREGLGGLALYDDEAVAYRDALSRIQMALPDDVAWSPRELEAAFQDAILRVLDERANAGDRRKREQRQAQAFAERLAEPPRGWTVYVPVVGFESDSLPRTFGGIAFSMSSKDKLRQILRKAGHKKRSRISILLDELKVLPESFVLAKATVDANDSRAAHERSRVRLQRVLDVLNFYADVLSPRTWGVRVAVMGTASDDVCQTLSLDDSSGTAHVLLDQSSGPFGLALPRSGSKRGRQIQLPRVNRLLASPQPTEHEERIVTAMQWAGRATVERRREVAFLLFAVALESAVVAEKRSAGLTDQIAMRAALLIASSPENRPAVMKTVRRLYDTRSRIVHAGLLQITDDELGEIRIIAKRTMLALLASPSVGRIRTAEEFERWMTGRMLGLEK